jgi:hypothetical protein
MFVNANANRCRKCGANAVVNLTTTVLLEKDLELEDQVQYLEMILDNKLNREQLHCIQIAESSHTLWRLIH